jgi:hypothetical protein
MNFPTLQRLQKPRQPDDVRVVEKIEEEVLHLGELLRSTQIQKENANLLILPSASTSAWRIRWALCIENSSNRYRKETYDDRWGRLSQIITRERIQVKTHQNRCTEWHRRKSAPRLQGPQEPLAYSAR